MKNIFELAKLLTNEAMQLRSKNRNKESNEKLENAQEILLHYLNDHPQDTKGWLLLTMIEYNPPLEDPYRIIKYTNNILSYDPTNAYALLLQACAYYFLLGSLHEDFYKKLCLAESNNPEIMSMIELAKTWYFEEKKDMHNYEIALQKSIQYSSAHQTNMSMLGIFYLNQGEISKGKELIKKALKNVKNVVTFGNYNPEKEDATNINDFFDYYYKGIVMQEDEYNHLKFLANS